MLLLVLSTGTGCSARHSPAGAEAESRQEREALEPPIPGLLGQRERLSLTSEQVVALDSIHRLWSAENGRLATRGTVISAGLFATSTHSVVSTSGPEARANHLRAGRAVEKVLEPEQRRAICDLYRARPEPVHRVWPWCGRPGG